jgi:hypothetical protein
MPLKGQSIGDLHMRTFMRVCPVVGFSIFACSARRNVTASGVAWRNSSPHRMTFVSVDLPGASTYIFLSNENDTVREMRSLVTGLQ